MCTPHGCNYVLFTFCSASFLLISGEITQEWFITVLKESELYRFHDRCTGLTSEHCGKYNIHILLLHLISLYLKYDFCCSSYTDWYCLLFSTSSVTEHCSAVVRSPALYPGHRLDSWFRGRLWFLLFSVLPWKLWDIYYLRVSQSLPSKPLNHYHRSPTI